MEQPQLIVDDTGLPPTHHRLVLGDARRMVDVDDESIALVVTSPPYWTLKKYPDNPAQLGDLDDYELFQKELARVWDECYRVLLPGGRLCVNVGDVTLSRRKHGRHRVVPLHADILAHARQAGFDALTPIFWWKRTNMTTEMSGDTYFLGKPYEPNGIIKNEIEYILLLRKPGGYRKPTAEQRRLSRIPKEDYHAWYRRGLDRHRRRLLPQASGAFPRGAGKPPGAYVLVRGRYGPGPVRGIRHHLPGGCAGRA